MGRLIMKECALAREGGQEKSGARKKKITGRRKAEEKEKKEGQWKGARGLLQLL